MMRLDMVAKSTGTQTYGIDLRMDDMVYATARTNPRLGGGLRSYDAGIAKNMRGVQKIIPITGGVGVVADNTWRAIQAANAIECKWGDAPYPATSEKMWDTMSDTFSSSYQDSQLKDEGDVEAALEGRDILEAEYRIPYLAHAPLEPMNAVVLLKDGRLDIWTGTQVPLFLIKAAQRITGLDTDDIHLHVQMMGGSFGRRLEYDYVQQAIEIALEMQGVPIKMTWSREEDMTHDYPRTLQMSRARGAVKDGQVHVYDLEISALSTTASQLARANQPALGPDVAIVAGAWDQPFAIQHYRVTGYRAPAMVPVSSWRSVGASGNSFFHEAFLDELIHKAGADPLAERLRLCTHEPSRKVLQAVGEMSGGVKIWAQTVVKGWHLPCLLACPWRRWLK